MAFDLEFKDYLTISISLAALAMSLLNTWRDSKHISLTIEKKSPVLLVHDFDGNELYPNQSLGIGVEIRFLNPSKHDIGFFDLVFRDYYSNEIIPVLYTDGLRPENRNNGYLGVVIDQPPVNLRLLETNNGLIKSNSYQRNEIIVYPISDKFRVNIKFAKRSFMFNFRSETNRFYKWRTKVIKLTQEDVSIVFKSDNQTN